MSSGERVLRVNGVDLCVETFGRPGDPAILLIGGATSSMDWWEADFCARLADGPRYVVRYDNRDTGRSTTYPAGAPDYAVTDLADDAIGLLDALAVDRAHIAGISMGGGIGQLLGVERPKRVASLTLMSTSPAGPGGPDNPDLPPIDDRLLAYFATRPPAPDWTDRAAVADHLVATVRRLAGRRGIDESRVRAMVERVVDRTPDLAANQTNHLMLDGGEPIRPRLAEISAPTLVIHGTEDPLFPLGHAEALAREIPGARLLSLDGVGHEAPPAWTWDVVVPAILRHTSEN